MSEVKYNECDRCRKKIEDGNIKSIIFEDEKKDLCKKCQEEFKKWISKKIF